MVSLAGETPNFRTQIWAAVLGHSRRFLVTGKKVVIKGGKPYVVANSKIPAIAFRGSGRRRVSGEAWNDGASGELAFANMSTMDRVVAYKLLSEELAAYRALAVDELSEWIETTSSNVRYAADGSDYLVEVIVGWADSARTGIRVSGTVGPADWGAIHDRLDDSFIVRVG